MGSGFLKIGGFCWVVGRGWWVLWVFIFSGFFWIYLDLFFPSEWKNKIRGKIEGWDRSERIMVSIYQ